MGFISFNEYYYRRKLEGYENGLLSDSDIYEAKQLLKVLDDLTDEGYTNLNNRMEEDFSCLTRLRNVIQKVGAAPFPIDHERLSNTTYDKEEYELEQLLGELITEAENFSGTSSNPFLVEIRKYSEWIGYEEDTAYIFLMRDALLPYVFFYSRNRDNIYPWLISRRFLEDITETENVDDDITIIHQDPAGISDALDTLGSYIDLCQFLFHTVHQGTDLVRVGTVGNDKVIGDYGDVPDLNDTDIFRFFVGECLVNQFYLILCIHRFRLLSLRCAGIDNIQKFCKYDRRYSRDRRYSQDNGWY